ncbi:hypothetical protein E2C01_093380 [Portunus trituberculatus]|uniref:Uncharacterized protein n=1 Tax=Portunus trituberculatus TaxID=210409 RepID=A0A5B7JMK8_PORTR|nr:hypothetical protein [Portunus trituberculatus]
MTLRTIFLRGVGGVEVVDPDGREGHGEAGKMYSWMLLKVMAGTLYRAHHAQQVTDVATPRIYLMVPSDLSGVHE